MAYSSCSRCTRAAGRAIPNIAAFNSISDFAALGVRPVVISIDPPDVSRALSREAGYTFTFLSDPSLAVMRRYDVANGSEARPAEFLLDSRGVVRWRNLTSNMFVRARPEQLLEAAMR